MKSLSNKIKQRKQKFLQENYFLFSFIKRAIGIVIWANTPILKKYYQCENEKLANDLCED